MELTEYDNKLDWKHIQDQMKKMEKEFEALNNAYKLQETALKKQHEDNGKLERRIHLLEEDLSLERVAYGRTTTRDYALKAFNQSTAEANWEGLGDHPVIKNIYQALKIRASDEGLRADDIIRKFENMPTLNEVMKEIGKHSEIENLWSRIKSCDDTISYYRKELTNATVHANQHDLKQRDKIADIQTAIHMMDFVIGEGFDKIDGVMMFLIGVFAEMGKGQIEKGLRLMLKKPKEPTNESETAPTEE